MTRTRRQSRRQSDFEDATDADEANARPPVRSSFTTDDMASMLTTLQESQTAAFERLLGRVLEHETRRDSLSTTLAAATTPAAAPSHALLGNFAKCTARFSGAPGDSLDGFIDATEAYKECAHVSDDNALRGLSMLLTGDASVWWQGIKSTISTWSDAVSSLRSAFGDTRPPHRIYLELFSMSQGREKTERFVARARALFARLPAGDVSEKVQIDMLYGLLHQRVRERVRRDEISSYEVLLQKSRHVEDATDEGEYQRRRTRTPQQWTSTTPGETSLKTTPPPRGAPAMPREPRGQHASSVGAATPPSRYAPITPREPRVPYNTSSNNQVAPSTGAAARPARDSAPRPVGDDGGVTASTINKVPTCYGCGTKGAIRSQCPKCTNHYNAVDVATLFRV